MNGETADESGWHRLESFRNEIDRIDDRILGLLSRRQAAAEGIGKVKRSLDLEIVDPARERHVLERLSARGQGCLDPETIRTVYSGIMAAARRIQEPPCAGVPGQEETAGHEEAGGFCGERHAIRHAGTGSPEQNLQSLHHAQAPGVLPAEGRGTIPDRALVGHHRRDRTHGLVAGRGPGAKRPSRDAHGKANADPAGGCGPLLRCGRDLGPPRGARSGWSSRSPPWSARTPSSWTSPP